LMALYVFILQRQFPPSRGTCVRIDPGRAGGHRHVQAAAARDRQAGDPRRRRSAALREGIHVMEAVINGADAGFKLVVGIMTCCSL